MKKILIVEDELELQDCLQAILSSRDLEVLVASNGFEALVIIKKVQVDLVLTDIEMPQMDGLELTKTIRSLNFTMPIIVMTGSSHYTKEDALSAGANGFATKPFHEFGDITKLISQ